MSSERGELKEETVDNLLASIRSGFASTLSTDLIIDIFENLKENLKRKAVPDHNPMLTALRTVLTPPQKRELNLKGSSEPIVIMHPVSLGADYAQARAAFYFNKEIKKVRCLN